MAVPVLPPVRIVASGGVPRTQASSGAPARVVVTDTGLNVPAITLTTNAPPIVLLDTDGNQYVAS